MEVQFKGDALPIGSGAAEALTKLMKLRLLRGKTVNFVYTSRE